MSVNICAVSGNLVRDAELRTTANDLAILNFTVAVNDRRKNSSGAWEDYPNYIGCVMFGKRASSVSEYLVKGTKVAVSGKLMQSRWEKDGKKHSKIEILVDDLDFNSKKPQGETQNLYDDEIPF